MDVLSDGFAFRLFLSSERCVFYVYHRCAAALMHSTLSFCASLGKGPCFQVVHMRITLMS